MESRELNSMIGGYVAGNVVSKTVANNLKKEIDKLEEWFSHHPKPETINAELSKFILSNDIDGGYKYLNGLVMEEYVHYAQHQEDSRFSIAHLIELVKTQYPPYYARLKQEMPSELATIDAKKLCETVDVPILREADITESELKEEKVERGEERSTASIVICAIVIIGIIIVAMAAGL